MTMRQISAAIALLACCASPLQAQSFGGGAVQALAGGGQGGGFPHVGKFRFFFVSAGMGIYT